MENFTSESSENGSFTNPQPRFFQRYLPEYNSAALGIPPPFIKNFNGNIPTKITLKNSYGSIWPAKLGYIGQKLHIIDGWEWYVRDHSLVPGEFLVFQYLRKSTFLVEVYSHNACLKEEPIGTKLDGLSSAVRRCAGRCTAGAATGNMIFYKTLTTFKNYLGFPKDVADELGATLPCKVKLRSDKHMVIRTQLR